MSPHAVPTWYFLSNMRTQVFPTQDMLSTTSNHAVPLLYFLSTMSAQEIPT